MRSRAGGKPVKTRHRKTASRKQRNAPKAARQRGSSAGGPSKKVALFKRERDEALEQLSAVSEILKFISSSPGDLKPIFDTILENATRICEAKFGTLYLRDGDAFRVAAMHNTPPAYAEARQREPLVQPPPDSILGRVSASKQVVHITDVREVQSYIKRNPFMVAGVELGGYRSAIGVPMLEQGALIGVVSIYRQEVRPFTDKQIELVQNFAAQAVIAIENTRLLNELRQRTDDLAESLEQQTATSEVLSIISSSPGELEPVFQTILANAVRICDAKFGALLRIDNETFDTIAKFDLPPAFAEYLRERGPFRPAAGIPLDRLLRTKDVVCIADASAEPVPSVPARFGGARSLIEVPMFKENVLVGAITIYRQEVRPFTEKQINLVKNFAAQAVIAIENTRLLNELRESLQQQIATADVLKVISRSTFDLQAVLDTLVQSATRLCDAYDCVLFLRNGERLELRAHHGPIAVDFTAFPIGRGWVAGRAVADCTPVHIHDLQSSVQEFPDGADMAFRLGHRTILAVPLMRQAEAIGAIAIRRTEVRPFTNKQIDLVSTFADQAVIAIENVRLFEAEQQRTRELTESLEQQTATSDVLKVISRSTFDLQAVLDTLVESAAKLCDANMAAITRLQGTTYRHVASHGLTPDEHEAANRVPIKLDRSTMTGRAVLERTIIHILDAKSDPDFNFPEGLKRIGFRTLLGVPLLREGLPIGVIVLMRKTVNAFTDKQIELVSTFADQAVIAIENVRLFEAEQQRTHELTESLEQQTATSDVLQVIGSSPGELEPVFQAMLENATRICNAKFGILLLAEGETYRHAALYGAPPAFAEAQMRNAVIHINPDTTLGRVVRTKKPVQVADIRAEPAYTRDPERRGLLEFAGARTMLNVPMLKDDVIVGQIAIFRQEVLPFTDKQVELLKNFAAQAVIAIENTRLLNELRESLEQQTATADVLRVISSSPGELEPVFQAMLTNAVRICGAKCGMLYRYDGRHFSLPAHIGVGPRLLGLMLGRPIDPHPDTVLGRVRATNDVVAIADAMQDRAYLERNPVFVAGVEEDGTRGLLGVPMLRENTLVGAFVVFRQEVGPFTEKQIKLVQNFAAQAVIAIENTRLLSELRESLEQQTATSKVLDVISRSAFDLAAVFETVAESSVRLCGADRAFIFRYDGELLRGVAAFNASPELKEFVERNPLRPGRHSGAARAALERRTIHIPDVLTDPEYSYGAKDVDPVRTVLGVPILKGNDLLGVLMIYHLEVRPFTEKQIALVETFADQAAIAIENVRLLDELRERTGELSRSVGELRALGEVSQAVNSTLDLEIVLSTIVAKAVQLSGTEAGAIYVFDDQQREFRLRATHGMDQELIDALGHAHIGVDEPNIALILAQREPIQVADLREEARTDVNEITLRAGFRARLVAPLIRGEDVVGLLVVRRRTPGEFARNTVDLLKTFAAQSVLAIQNARLFDSVESRTRELAKSLRDLQTAQDRLVQTEKLASLGQLTAGIAHEIKNPLNFVNNFSSVSVELIDELRQALGSIHLDSKVRAEITEIADTLQGNLDKVVQHGKRADAIVKNMLLHSRQGSGEHRPVEINALVEESLNLAYHGARAEKQGFEITLERSFDPAAGKVDVFPQEITRALLNLISNGFYAATKRKAEANGGDYEPTVTAITKNLGNSVEIRIRDNGTGIPPEVECAPGAGRVEARELTG